MIRSHPNFKERYYLDEIKNKEGMGLIEAQHMYFDLIEELYWGKLIKKIQIFIKEKPEKALTALSLLDRMAVSE